MEKIVVICNNVHEIEPGVCALCERDKAKEEIQRLSEIIRNMKKAVFEQIKNTGFE